MKQARPHSASAVATTLGAVLLAGGLWLSCQPGDLPCDSSPEWAAVCTDAAAGGAGGGMGTGGTGGTGGAPPAISATTAVADCAQWPTLGDMDRFFSSRCGLNSTCHGVGTPWTVMPVQGVWDQFTKELTSGAKLSCAGGKLASRTSWTNSVLWTKTQTPVLPCPPGSTGMMTGLSMPPQRDFMPLTDPLTPVELKCLEGFLKAIAGVR